MIDPTGFAAQRFGNNANTTQRKELDWKAYADMARYCSSKAILYDKVAKSHQRGMEYAYKRGEYELAKTLSGYIAKYNTLVENYDRDAREYKRLANIGKGVDKLKEKTEPILKALFENNKKDADHMVTVLDFKAKVETGAEWDYKLPKKRRDEPILKDIKDEEYVYFNGYVMTWEEFGNYHYGYIGRAAGISLELLKFGSSWADGFTGSYNERIDKEWVRKGFNDSEDRRYLMYGGS